MSRYLYLNLVQEEKGGSHFCQRYPFIMSQHHEPFSPFVPCPAIRCSRHVGDVCFLQRRLIFSLTCDLFPTKCDQEILKQRLDGSPRCALNFESNVERISIDINVTFNRDVKCKRVPAVNNQSYALHNSSISLQSTIIVPPRKHTDSTDDLAILSSIRP